MKENNIIISNKERKKQDEEKIIIIIMKEGKYIYILFFLFKFLPNLFVSCGLWIGIHGTCC